MIQIPIAAASDAGSVVMANQAQPTTKTKDVMLMYPRQIMMERISSFLSLYFFQTPGVA